MREMKRIVALLLPLVLFGCTQGTSTYSKELAAYLNQDRTMSERYRGLAEYGYDLTLKEIEETSEVLVVTYYGVMNDGISDTGDRSFEAIYTVDATQMVLTIIQTTPNPDENLLHSLIANQVVLQLPLEDGRSWTQTFPYKGETFSAKNVLKQVDDSTLEVETTVDNIAWYFENQYLEKRVYQKGVGLVSFSNLFDLDYQKDNPEMDSQEDYLFGYTLQPKPD